MFFKAFARVHLKTNKNALCCMFVACVLHALCMWASAGPGQAWPILAQLPSRGPHPWLQHFELSAVRRETNLRTGAITYITVDYCDLLAPVNEQT